METMKKYLTSWVAIVLAFIIFWPIGFILLYFRFFVNGGILRANANLFWGLAILFYLIVCVGLIAITNETGEELKTSITMIIFFLAGGIGFTIPALKITRKYKYYKNYVDYIVARRKVSIEELAQKLGETIETVTQNVSKIIQYKMIEGYINEENEIVLFSSGNIETPIINTMPEKKQILIVKCKNCGASNKFIVGKDNRCEYCDSLLENN